MDQSEEREIMQNLRSLASRRDQLVSELKEARGRSDDPAEESIKKEIESITAAMSPGFERLYREHHPKLRLMALHTVRSPDHADDIEQEGWKRFNAALPRFDLEMPAFPLLASCVRTAGIDYYRPQRNRYLPQSGDDLPDIIDIRQTPEADTIARFEAEVRSEVFFGLLCFAMGRSGGPVHERLSFGFNRLLESLPRVIVKTQAHSRLAEMTATLLLGYIKDSGLPESRVLSAFQSLHEDLPRRLFEADRATAEKYRATRLPQLPVGEGLYGDYLPVSAEAAVGQWTDNVMRRLKKVARPSGGHRNKVWGGA